MRISSSKVFQYIIESERIRHLELQKQEQEANLLKNGGWACQSCRTVNEKSIKLCSVCNMKKPEKSYFERVASLLPDCPSFYRHYDSAEEDG